MTHAPYPVLMALDPLFPLWYISLAMDKDEFGHDPAVRSMRRVFAQMEEHQRKILKAAALPSIDRRIRVWREQALRLFEQGWAKAGKRGIARTEEEAALLYAFCLARILERGRISLPPEVLPHHEALEEIVKEMFK